MDKRNLLLIVAALMLVQIAPGCIEVQVTKLPTFGQASGMYRPEHPKLFYRESVSTDSLPACVSFAILQLTAGSTASKEGMARQIWGKAKELGADIVMVQDGNQSYAGSVNTYWGFGISTSQPVYNQVLIGICLKVPSGRIGLLDDPTGMATVLLEGGHMREAGLLEGDKILSMDGVPWDLQSQSSGIQGKLLALAADQEVSLVWVRPGTGRMEGKGKCMPNPPVHLGLPDAFPWEEPRRYEEDHTPHRASARR